MAFGVDPALYKASNGYVISEQGKPPDFVLEVASEGTGHVDVGEKREFYEGLGIPEYWRFDAIGEFHGAKLSGDRLVGGRYEPIDIAEVAGGVLEGHSAVLNVNWRWEDGRLGCHDPATGEHIATFESERLARLAVEARADTAEVERDAEQEARINAEAQRNVAKARVCELEAELRRLRGG